MAQLTDIQFGLLRTLHRSLDERHTPEDVAIVVRKLLATGGAAEPLAAAKTALDSVGRGWANSSMLRDFHRPSDFAGQFDVAGALFAALPPGDAADIAAVEAYLERIAGEIGKTLGQSDFLHDRLNRDARASAGLGHLSRRQYNKRFRLVARMEAKRERVVRERAKRSLALASKSRLASTLGFDDLARDVPTACFVAYYVARANLRSVFTNARQARPFDTVCAALIAVCERRPSETNWLAIAHALPDAKVLQRLADGEKAALLADYFGLLETAAGLLRETAEAGTFDRATMIVRRGDDSSTWNLAAGAWNKLREGWFQLLFALGLGDAVERCCPGKAMRLMAGDVASWHRGSGGSVHPDTRVWADLPAPWEVLAGEADCTAADVRAACVRHNVDAERSGWVCPPTVERRVEAFAPTPELVHGVAVASPSLARVMRRSGVFSGKAYRPGRVDRVEQRAAEATVEQTRFDHWLTQEMRREAQAAS